MRRHPDSTPEFFVLSGPNGAGKSTTAARLLPEDLHVINFVNADIKANEEPQLGDVGAGRWAVERMRELIERGESFAFETTLSSRSLARTIERARTRGFAIHLVFIHLDSCG